MNSTAKGDRLELAVFEIFERLVAAGQWGLPECCKVRRKPRYYSKEREAEIEFDISIEISRSGASSYSILVLIECKNCERKVSIDDAEEFESKKRQVAGSKAIIVSAQGFQEGTITFAKSNRIGLARHFDKSSLKWVLDRTPSVFGVPPALNLSPSDVHQGLVSQEYGSRYSDCYCFADGKYTTSLGVFLERLLRPITEDDPALASIAAARAVSRTAVEYVSDEDIESMTEGILQKIDYTEGEVPLQAICEWQAKEVGLRTRTDVAPSQQELMQGVSGRLSANPLEITIFSHPASHLGRQRFTLGHELGHHFLGHLKYFASETCADADIEAESRQDLGSNDIQRMEWQANHFASCLLLPKGPLKKDLLDLAHKHNLLDRGFGLLYVDRQPCNLRTYHIVTSVLMLKYMVSKTVVALRLKRLGYLRDERSFTTSLGSIIRDMRDT